MIIFKATFFDVCNDKYIEHYISFDGYIATNVKYAWFRATEIATEMQSDTLTLEALEIIAY